MITPSDIVSHLQTHLHRVTDLFSVTVPLSSQTVTAERIIRLVSSSAHNITAGRSVMVPTGRVDNRITAVSVAGENLEFTTQYTHDLTNTDMPLDDANLEMEGFTDAVYNATFNIQTITAENKFQIVNPGTGAPALNGAETLIENRPLGVRGLLEISQVIDATTFELEIPSTYPPLPLTGVREMTVVSGLRVGAAATLNRAEELYTKQSGTNPWLYVIMSDVDANKDRNTHSDAVLAAAHADQLRQRFLQHFMTSVFIPTSDDLSGSDAQQSAYGPIFTALLKVLFGARFSGSDDRSDFLAVSNGHGPEYGNDAFYVHSYEWQHVIDINYVDGVQGNIFEDVAFRQINGNLKPFDPDGPDGFEFTTNLL